MALGAEDSRESAVGKLQLPKGFRFHPTDEELVLYYLCPKAESQPFAVQIIADVDIYKFDPWNLPEKAVQGENEWYFFSPRDRKYPNGSRPNRAAGSGYWKATGTDKHITCVVDGAGPGHTKKMGVKKALVFYKGRPPNGTKTNWIMHEYRLTDGAGHTVVSANSVRRRKGSLRLDDWVLCRIYKKRSSSDSIVNSKQEERADTSRRDNMLEMDPENLMPNSKLFKKRRLTNVPANGMPLYVKQMEDWGKDVRRQDMDNLEMSSYVVEEFLASLPEIESSKLFINQLQVLQLPKLEGNSSHILEQDMSSIGSVVMDHIPIGEDIINTQIIH